MRAKLEQWPRVVSLLEQSNGVFQAAIRTNQTSELVLSGFLLLGEARLAQKNYSGAEAALQPMASILLDPNDAWQRQFLLCRIQLADNRQETALRGTTNLVKVAAQTGEPALQSQSSAFQAGILESLGRFDAAILAYTNNLVAIAPPDRQREA